MIDMHCHLDLYASPSDVVRRCREENTYVLSVTTTPKAWRGTVLLANGCPRIRTALGMHPEVVHQRIAELGLFDALLSEAKYVGEIGLDGSPSLRPHWGTQMKAFDHILGSVAAAGGRVMSIHSRRAVGQVLDGLARHPDAGVAVLHWFTGSKSELGRAIGMGCWFSVGPEMFRSERGRELVASMPPERVLTETDGPFTNLGDRPLQPSDVGLAVDGLARVWKTDRHEAEGRLRESLRQLLVPSRD